LALAAAISATEFETVWEPAASLWDLAMARSSAILSFPSIISALLAHNYQTTQNLVFNIAQKDKQYKTMHGES